MSYAAFERSTTGTFATPCAKIRIVVELLGEQLTTRPWAQIHEWLLVSTDDTTIAKLLPAPIWPSAPSRGIHNLPHGDAPLFTNTVIDLNVAAEARSNGRAGYGPHAYTEDVDGPCVGALAGC